MGLFFFPLVLVILQIGEGLYSDLEIGTCTAGEEIAVNLLKGDARVDIDAVLLKFCLFQYEDRHELSEDFAHGIYAPLPCFHVVNLVTHGQEHRLHSSSMRCVVDVRVALRNVRHTDEGRAVLHFGECFLEALQTAHLAEGEVL